MDDDSGEDTEKTRAIVAEMAKRLPGASFHLFIKRPNSLLALFSGMYQPAERSGCEDREWRLEVLFLVAVGGCSR